MNSNLLSPMRRQLLLMAATAGLPLASDANNSASIGEAQIALPAPEGFERARGVGNYILDLVSPTRRIVEAFVPVGTISSADDINSWPKRYLTVSTLSKYERNRATPEFFAQLREAMKGSYQQSLNVEAERISQVASQGLKFTQSELRSARIVSTKVEELLSDKSTAISFYLSSQLELVYDSGMRKSMRPLGLTLLLIKGKVLYLNTHASEMSESDVRWVRETTVSWPSLIENSN